MIEYPVGSSGQVIIFESGAIDHFRRHRQRRRYQNEAGGQLFARFVDHRILIEEATGPRRTDRRTRTSYEPDRRAEQREIKERHSMGLHYVGDWHTHPEPVPRPSPLDAMSIGECVKKSRHLLNGFVLVVVGQAEPPAALHVIVYDGIVGFSLAPSQR